MEELVLVLCEMEDSDCVYSQELGINGIHVRVESFTRIGVNPYRLVFNLGVIQPCSMVYMYRLKLVFVANKSYAEMADYDQAKILPQVMGLLLVCLKKQAARAGFDLSGLKGFNNVE